jgi:parallel beta-helix repeat protein
MPPTLDRSAVGLSSVALVALVAIVAGLVLAVPPAAQASHVRCGDTLTADTALDADLADCANNGVVIGANGITLDLNGHTIDGDGSPFAECPKQEICDVGVLNEGHNRVTIRDGSTLEFGIGVLVGGARRNEVVKISSSKNEFFGAVLGDSASSEVRNGSFSDNVAPEGDGIGLFGSDHIKVVRNSIQGNPGPGIHVDDSADNLIKRNRMARNGPSMLIEGDDNVVRHNRVIRGGGILMGQGDDNLIAGNRISRAGDALAVENGSGNLVARNLVIGSRGDGIRLGIGAPPIGGGRNIVRRNLVKRSSEDGFHVFSKDGHSVLRNNVAIRSGDDGIEVQNGTTKLTGNRAVRNADLGIRAVPGVIDGGGNVARYNGDARQCTNLRCS